MPRKFQLCRIRKNGERKGRKCIKHKVPTRWEDQLKRLDKIIDNQHNNYAIMMIVPFVYYM